MQNCQTLKKAESPQQGGLKAKLGAAWAVSGSQVVLGRQTLLEPVAVIMRKKALNNLQTF